NSIGQETVVDMATDAHGNVYALSKVNGASGSITVGGISKNTYGGSSDMIISSHNCNGVLRWIKCIGTNASNDTPTAISVDGANNVYVSGFMPPLSTTLYFDVDTIQLNHTKNFFIVSYDSSGVYRWLKQPGSDTITDLIRQDRFKRYSDMVGSPSGGVYNMSYMPKGLLAGGDGVVVPQDGMYITQYNANGNIVSLTPLDMQVNPQATNFNNLRLVRTLSGKFMIAGKQSVSGPPPLNYTLYMGGQKINHAMFCGFFNSAGNLIWKKANTDTLNAGAFTFRPVYYNNKFYFGGGTIATDTINGFIPVNTLSTTLYGLPIVVVFDTLGNLVWGSNASTVQSGSNPAGVVVFNNKLYTGGSYAHQLKWRNSITLNNPLNSGTKLFVAALDINTGNNLFVDSIKGTVGYNDKGDCIVGDNKGNIYLGGSIGANVTVNGQVISSVGGTSDFFIAKFGTANCSNAVVPITLKAFTAHLKQQQVHCNWQSVQEVNSSHYIVERSVNQINYSNIATLPTTGSGNQYNYTDYLSKELQQVTKTLYYRLALVDKDGSTSYSSTVAINLSKQQQIQVYPNPVKDQLTLVFPYAAEKLQVLQLYSLQGIMVLQTYLNAHTQILTIPVKKLSKGSYLVKVQGHSTVVVIKD
ncbi:MAG: T9SS type A sorting domain-containing protein, partial [Bacteroidia bacterium]|nr:T9SS type A sorting domain-containing protein [Bacteroidia bacterium]